MRTIGLVSTFAALLASAPLAAQARTFRTGDVLNPTQIQQTGQQGGRRSNANIPPGQLPPAGMCRIWIDGVPPGRQPAPTDCQTAIATRPANARVLFGDQQGFPGNGRGKFKSQNGRGGGAVNGRRNGDGNDAEDDNDGDDNNGTILPGGIGSTQSPAIRVSRPAQGREFSKKGKGHGKE